MATKTEEIVPEDMATLKVEDLSTVLVVPESRALE